MFGFSELEDKILSGEGAEAVKSALADLDALQARTQSEIDKGLPPQEFAKAEMVLGAITASRKILAMPTNRKE